MSSKHERRPEVLELYFIQPIYSEDKVIPEAETDKNNNLIFTQIMCRPFTESNPLLPAYAL